jgi:hypothetical protein
MLGGMKLIARPHLPSSSWARLTALKSELPIWEYSA